MSKDSETWFISDLHLDPKNPKTTRLFFELLDKSLNRNINALYILGDLFEAWIGDDDLNDFSEAIIQRLGNLTKTGLSVYLLPGNRDFLMGSKFVKKTGCLLLNDPSVISLHGERVLVSHGDTLCTLDKKYIRARKWLRHPMTKACFLALPLGLRRQIANKMRNQSKLHMQYIPDEVMDVVQETVVQQMTLHDVNFLIHGHTHRPNIHEFQMTKLAESPSCSAIKRRIVLAAWHKQGHFLRWTSSGAFEMVYFN